MTLRDRLLERLASLEEWHDEIGHYYYKDRTRALVLALVDCFDALDALGEWEKYIRGWNPVSPGLAKREKAIAAVETALGSDGVGE